MTIFGEFHVPSEAFALHRTLQRVPDTAIEIERVVASKERLTPYFWVVSDDLAAFEDAASDDPSVSDLRELDVYDSSALYRAEWTRNVEAIAFAYTNVGAIIIEAAGKAEAWELQIRFDDRRRLDEFRDYCADEDIQFALNRLYDESQPRSGAAFGLTEKQAEALLTAWERGYFEVPRQVTLAEVAEELAISKESLSKRLRRGNDALVTNALHVTAPDDEEAAL